MLEVTASSIRHLPGKEGDIQLSVFRIDWEGSGISYCTVPSVKIGKTFPGYDRWVQLFPCDKEVAMVKKAITQAKKGTRMHIRGISSAESVQLLMKYYEKKGYKNTLEHCIVPDEEPLTVSISLRHFLWCDKDKAFLTKKDASGIPYYAITPPIRTSHDLRAIQQAVRGGIIPAIEVYPGDEQFLYECIEKELIPIFQLGRACYYNWESILEKIGKGKGKQRIFS